MATGIKRLRKIYLGDEGTPGSAVDADTIWRGVGAGPEILDDIQFVEEDTGTFGGSNRSVKVSAGAQIALAATPLTFEQFPLLCQMGIEAQQTGVADGAGTGKIYTFDFPLTSANTMRTYTVEAGNNEECWDIEYCFCPEFTITGGPNAAVTMAGLLRGRQATPGQSFTSLTVSAVDEAVFNLSKLYLDAAAGTMGATNVAGSFLGFTLNVTTGLIPVTTGDGQLYFYNVEQVGWVGNITADVVFKHVAGTDTEHANWLAQTARLLEIKLEGPTLTTAGTDYTKKTVRLQLPGKWQSFAVLSDVDGVDILTGTFRVAKETTPDPDLGPKVVVVNQETNYWA
jgi:hypothetical protein